MKLFATRAPSRARIIAAGVLAPAAAVGVARALGPENLATATALCLLGVVVAAAVGGLASGIVASVVAFLGLNFFFTEPFHTLAVREAGDLIGLFAFLLSALIVGALVSRVLEERSRAERRATEAHFLSQTTAKLISGEPFDRILDDFAGSLVRLFGLVRCEISTPHGTGAAGSDAEDATAGSTISIPLETQSGSFGTLTAVLAGDDGFAPAEVELLRSLARQTAMAIERAGLDEEVRGARIDAEASRLRAALFSSVTHDLKTPLASIKASASGLLAGGAEYSPGQREEMLRTVLEEADHLNQIVSNLLDLARMRAGTLVPSKQPVLIEDVVASALSRMRRTLEGTVVRTVIRPDLPAVDVDPVQFGQVFSNLLENAVRFSPRGSEIQIAAARWEHRLRVRVVDRGPGIAEEDRTRVFDEFYTRDAGGGRGGSGLGLTIARAIIEAHGGTISAQAAPGGGTAIVFELPVPSTVPAPAAPAGREDVTR